MSELKRTGTIVNGQFLPAGSSHVDITRDAHEQYVNVINPHTGKGKDQFDRYLNFQQQKDSLFNRWKLCKETTTENCGTFKQYFEKKFDHNYKPGGSRRRRSLRKYKKSKRVFRKKSRATRRR
jgi:hypothetical protein